MAVQSPESVSSCLNQSEYDQTCRSVPFTANCPRFQEDACAAANRLTAIFEHLDVANREMKKFCKAGLNMSKAYAVLGDLLMDSESIENSWKIMEVDDPGISPKSNCHGNTSNNIAPDELISALVKFGSLLQNLAHAQQLCMNGLHQTFIDPLEIYCNDAVNELAATKKIAATSAEAYTLALRKLLQGQLKSKLPGSDGNLDQRSVDLAIVHAESEKARFMYARTLSVMREKQFLKVSDCLLTTTGSLESYYRQCADMTDTYTPHRVKLQKEQERVRTSLRKSEAPWLEQGRELVAALAVSQPDTPRKSKGVPWGDNTGGSSPENQIAPQEKYNCWDQAKRLNEIYTPRTNPPSQYVKEGYLFKRSSGKVLHNWQRRWFVLDGTQLCYLKPPGISRGKEDKDIGIEEGESGILGCDGSPFSRVLVCDVLLSTVRDVSGVDLAFCFEIHSANRRSYMLQAEGPYELATWKAAIRECISKQLCGQDHPHSRPDQPGGTKLIDSLKGGSSQAGSIEMVKKIMKDNPNCADCGTPLPNWVSINLGVVLCIGCSGIHRSLGSHISKVRSLTLDALSEFDLCVVAAIGNKGANAILEETIQAGWTKPMPDSSRETKEAWIQAKYVWRGFLKMPLPPADMEEVALALSTASETDDLFGILISLLHGADINKHSGPLKWTALHRAAAADAVNACSMLILNGSELSLHDVNQCTPLDVATLKSALSAVEFLSFKSET